MPGVESVLAQSSVDRRSCNRTTPMEVLVLGLCRTGTLCMYLLCTGALVSGQSASSLVGLWLTKF